jgi:Sec7-like guanine-nucleotide exchange factor
VFFLFSENSENFQGMKYLIEKGCVDQNAEVIASFMRTEKKLKKQSIGQYLGES